MLQLKPLSGKALTFASTLSFKLAIVNPRAGSARKRKEKQKIVERLSAEGVTIRFTSKRGDAVRLAREAVLSGAEEVISVGGDGTHHETVNGLLSARRAKPIFFPITVGSGSDLQRAVGAVSLAEQFLDYRVEQVDVGLCKTRSGSRFFINIADFGVGGHVVAAVNRTTKSWGGFLTFLVKTLQVSLRYSSKRMRVYFDSGIEEGEYFNVVVANGQFFGAGMHIAPYANMQDDAFDLLLIQSMSPLKGVRFLASIYRGNHLLDKEVRFLRTRKVSATAFGTVLIDLDGEEGGQLPASFEIFPKALRLRAPWR